MAEQRRPPSSGARPKGKSPAERAEEFTATQRRLKQEAADRRAAPDGASKGRGKPKKG